MTADYFAHLSKKSQENIRNEVKTFLANDSLHAATSLLDSQGRQYIENADIIDKAAATSLGLHRTTTPTLIESSNLKKEYLIAEADNRRAIEKRDEEHQKELERMRAEREFEPQRVTHIAKAEMAADAEKVAINTGTHSLFGLDISLDLVQAQN
jgi:serine phosphatase RsbU (regulator of sigma subunit)